MSLIQEEKPLSGAKINMGMPVPMPAPGSAGPEGGTMPPVPGHGAPPAADDAPPHSLVAAPIPPPPPRGQNPDEAPPIYDENAVG